MRSLLIRSVTFGVDCIWTVHPISSIFGSLAFLWTLFSMMCSVAAEPALEEWTSRTELCDRLHEPVGTQEFLKFGNLSYEYFVPGFLYFYVYRSESQWLESIQVFQILTSLY